jgi:hypothetical protein
MQSSQAVFTSQGSGGSIITIIMKNTPLSGVNKLGIYDVTDPSRKIMLFNGTANPGDQAFASFLADGTIIVTFTLSVPGFSGNFGFYLDVFGADSDVSTLDYTLYTEDSLNPAGAAQALVYAGDGSAQIQLPGFAAGSFVEGDWIVAFEDGVGQSSDNDFSDFVFIAESLSPGEVDRPELGCRVTAGGVDQFDNWIYGTYEEGLTYWADLDEPDRYQFGGQAGANTALPPIPSGEWQHHQQRGPSGSFSFHGGTHSSPDGTQIVEIRCSDPGGCSPSGNPPSPVKQLDFDAIGTFQSLGKKANAPMWQISGANVAVEPKGRRTFNGTFHWFEVNLDDLGEPGNSNPHLADTQQCPINGFGEKGNPLLADCECPDFYRITIYDGVNAADVSWVDGKIDPASLNRIDIIYEVWGYINGGNIQLHHLTGFDTH